MFGARDQVDVVVVLLVVDACGRVVSVLRCNMVVRSVFLANAAVVFVRRNTNVALVICGLFGRSSPPMSGSSVAVVS